MKEHESQEEVIEVPVTESKPNEGDKVASGTLPDPGPNQKKPGAVPEQPDTKLV
jgi:hypothetical protein